MKYSIITPVLNEAKTLRQTIDSVIAQSIQPTVWVFSDGGSTDKTCEIITEYSMDYPFIKLVKFTSPHRGDKR